jgi:hypothetical protein
MDGALRQDRRFELSHVAAAQNVSFSIYAVKSLTGLLPDCAWAINYGSSQAPQRRDDRDWRALRTRLIGLNFEDKKSVASWLDDAGYFPLRGDPNTIKFRHRGLSSLEVFSGLLRRWEDRESGGNSFSYQKDLRWTEKDITEALTAWFRVRREIAEWCMRLDCEEFRSVVRAIALYTQGMDPIDEEAAKEREGYQLIDKLNSELASRLKLPAGMDVNKVISFIRQGAQHLDSDMVWMGEEGTSLRIHIYLPLQAIAICTCLDKRYTKRRIVECSNCGKVFEQDRTSNRYCSTNCRNYDATKMRRAKIRLLKKGEEEWRSLPESARKGKDRFLWIKSRAEKAWARDYSEEIEIELDWVKQQLV